MSIKLVTLSHAGGTGSPIIRLIPIAAMYSKNKLCSANTVGQANGLCQGNLGLLCNNKMCGDVIQNQLYQIFTYCYIKIIIVEYRLNTTIENQTNQVQS